MPYPYITPKQLSNRLGAELYHRVFDDNNDGVADIGTNSPVDEVIQDASARVAGVLRNHYSLDLIAENTPREVVRLTLDVAKVYTAQRYPEVVGYDWKDLDDALTRELRALGKGDTRLDVVGAPEPGRNHGTYVASGNVNDPETRPHWRGNFGYF